LQTDEQSKSTTGVDIKFRSESRKIKTNWEWLKKGSGLTSRDVKRQLNKKSKIQNEQTQSIQVMYYYSSTRVKMIQLDLAKKNLHATASLGRWIVNSQMLFKITIYQVCLNLTRENISLVFSSLKTPAANLV